MDGLPRTSSTPAATAAVRTGLPDPSAAVCVHICPTTGGQIDLRIAQGESVETLKKNIGKKLKIPRERISLLYRDRLLKEGTVIENGISDGCKITLLPNVESGLMSQKADNNVMQALENLTDMQVHEFLEGKAPLTLAMRLGEHMMLVQLQLSTTQLNSRRSSSFHSKTSASRHSPNMSMHTASSASRATGVARPATVSNSVPTVSRTAAVKQQSTATNIAAPNMLPNSPIATVAHGNNRSNSKIPVLNSVTLETASRNLHQRLREFSKYSNVPKSAAGRASIPSPIVSSPSSSPSSSASSSLASSPASSPESSPAPSPTRQSPTTSPSSSPATSPTTSSSSNPGAIIETMHHHGHGVYSGTFSGTLNPALQDVSGKPKRHISTIIHILNDLLCASPQYRSHLGHHHLERRAHHHHYHHHHHRHARSPQHARNINEQMRVSQENQLMRSKMDHLHVMMEERRQRRRERRQARSSPYATWRHQHTTPSPTSDSSDNSMDVDSNLEASSVTDVNENIYNEFSQETVVV